MLLLRIFYKAFYKTKNRREHTISAFSGFLTFHIIGILFIFILLIPFNPTEIISDLDALKIIYAILFIGLGYFVYRLLYKYSYNLLYRGNEDLELSYSVFTCRVIVSLLYVTFFVYVILLFIYF